MINEIIHANALHIPLADASVQCCVTSPPYWGLRDYGLEPTIWGGAAECAHVWGDEMVEHKRGQVGECSTLGGGPQPRIQEARQGAFCQECGAWRGCLGLEPTPELYVEHMVAVFREVRRVLRNDGTVWLNLGDSFYGGKGSNGNSKARRTADERGYGQSDGTVMMDTRPLDMPQEGLKPKDLVGIPWRVAFALQADGWWLRSDIIWCLSGGTWLYVRSQKGDMPMMLKDAARLDPATVKLWDGNRWAQVLGWNRSARQGQELEIVLRSGERIACTPEHKFPTSRGLLTAGELQKGDRLERVTLPEPESVRDCAIDEDAAWFAGLYLAEGSMCNDKIQIAGHSKETARWERVARIAERFGGSATRVIDGNKMDIRVFGKVLVAIVRELVTGHSAHDKGFAPVVWRYSNRFIEAMVDGYLSGDGYWEEGNQRWRLAFTRNYNLERDLRTACARLSWNLVLSLASVKYDGREVPTFRGELRKTRSGHRNQKESTEIMEIRRARCRYVYDVGVEGDPHLFALASGILTHNSKPNPMPESVTDRPTKAHEYVFLLTKSDRYYWDQEAVREKGVGSHPMFSENSQSKYQRQDAQWASQNDGRRVLETPAAGRNLRTVWTIATAPYSGAHFATMPPALVEPCIKAGTSEKGACPKCGKPWVRIVEREGGDTEADERPKKTAGMDSRTSTLSLSGNGSKEWAERGSKVQTLGWRPGCECNAGEPGPCVIVDPFAGSGTVGMVAAKLGRSFVGLDLQPAYIPMAVERTDGVQMVMVSS